MIRYLTYGFLLVSLAIRLPAFSNEDLERGLVKKIDLPEGHSVLAPAFFKIEESGQNALSFGDPQEYVYCTVDLLPVEPQRMDETLRTLLRVMQEQEKMPDVEIGRPEFKHYMMGESKKAVLNHLPTSGLVKVGFFHLLVQTDEALLHIVISVPMQYQGKYAGMETRFARMILLSLQDSSGIALKPVIKSHANTPVA